MSRETFRLSCTTGSRAAPSKRAGLACHFEQQTTNFSSVMSRKFRDAQGGEWEILKVAHSSDRGNAVRAELANGWYLLQRSDGHRVRVAAEHVPADWEQLSDSELEQLIARGLRVSKEAGVLLRPNDES